MNTLYAFLSEGQLDVERMTECVSDRNFHSDYQNNGNISRGHLVENNKYIIIVII